MKRRILACLLLLWAVCLFAADSLAVDNGRKGSITVLLPGGELTLYKVDQTTSGQFTPEYAKLLEAELAGTEGIHRRIEEGCVVFSDLEPGIYLICQTEEAPGYQDICPFFVPIPLLQGEEWIYDVCACPKTDPLPEDPINPDTGGNRICVIMLLFSAVGVFLLIFARDGTRLRCRPGMDGN